MCPSCLFHIFGMKSAIILRHVNTKYHLISLLSFTAILPAEYCSPTWLTPTSSNRTPGLHSSLMWLQVWRQRPTETTSRSQQSLHIAKCTSHFSEVIFLNLSLAFNTFECHPLLKAQPSSSLMTLCCPALAPTALAAPSQSPLLVL